MSERMALIELLYWKAARRIAPPALTCRIYHLPDGRVSPVPSRRQLEEAFDELHRR
jgi:hypothetical protein